jgi:hypothetical protein
MDKTLLPKGHTSCLSRAFKYVPATNTDVAKTFARIRRQLRQPAPAVDNVSLLKPRKVG